MRNTLIAGLSVAALTFAACSSDNASGGSQDEVADLMIQSAEETGFEIDEACVRDITDQLSDDDAEKIVEAGIDGDPDVSDEADALALELIDCVVL